MKQNFKKLMALVLSLTMMLGLSVTAFAGDFAVLDDTQDDEFVLLDEVQEEVIDESADSQFQDAYEQDEYADDELSVKVKRN